MKDRPLPACLEAEKLILGSLLSGHLAHQQAREAIGPDDFSVESHRRLFGAISDLAERGEAVNRVAVYQRLEERKQAESCGGLGYLADLQGDSIPLNLTGYLQSVREAAIRRRAILACQTAANDLWAGADSPLDVLNRAERSFGELGRALPNHREAPEFSAIGEDRYRLKVPGIGITFECDRLRRDRHELVGELSVRCDLPGARAVNGVLSIADFNLSSARARSERARLLAERARAQDVDWPGLLEEFCQRVLQADRAGQPAVDLRDLAKPEADDAIRVEGLVFPRRHPTVIFGDGGTAKSYTALYIAGRLAERGMAVALFDWELAGDDHRERLERLFGAAMPHILYARCERPLVYEADRLRRIVRENNIEFAVFDSVAFACDGPPEAAEVAGRYFRAVREIGCGSLHVAHTSKADGADKKPFGSVFWANGARSTWYVQVDPASAESDILKAGFFNRKSNLGRLSSPVAFSISFVDGRTTFSRADVADSPALAVQLSIRQRMAYLLRRGAMTPEAIAEEIEADLDTVTRTARRYRQVFTVLEGGRLALLERTGS